MHGPPKSTKVDIASESMRDHNQHETASPTQTSSDNDHIDLEIGIAAECMYPDGYLDWLRNKYIGWNGSDPSSDFSAEMAQWVRLIAFHRINFSSDHCRTLILNRPPLSCLSS
jgi:hypothetical protein